ncbi:methyl-accepting chemotaxis protein [Desulfovibrio desulfuricans]|uniref:methyl-accepting chemotaxis protein n=1 Tax=Desulfovibrio desulfuricans TaxID=876 RepID=UPI001CE04BB4|nr:methyl-accepting chemotaxis protein [Desulfovibrio desulfuricans]
MQKITTMQKMAGLSLLLCLFTVIIGMFGVSRLSNLATDVEELSSMHMKGLDLLRMTNIEVLRIIREEKNLIISTSEEGNRFALNNLQKEYVVLDKYHNELPRYFMTESARKLLAELNGLLSEWRTVHNKVVELGSTTDPAMNEKAQEISSTTGRALAKKLADLLQDIGQKKLEFAQELSRKSMQEYERARMITIVGVLLSVLVGLGVGYFLSRNMLRQLGDEPASLSELALQIAGGDLEAKFNPARPEIGVFGAMKQMVATLKGKIAEADQKSQQAKEESERAQKATADAEEARRQAERAKAEGMLQAAHQLEGVVEIVTSASEELSAQVEQSSRGADEQSARVRETATAMEEMNATVLEVARNAQQAADVSNNARKQAIEGSQIVNEAVKGISTVHTQSLALKQDMDALGKQAESIGQVMGVIADIADQTNLLALNAAIEAARAGDAGRGFAVVADEVRKLAEKTMTATQEVGRAIKEIQEGTKKNIQSVEFTGESIEAATKLSVQSGESLKNILECVQLVNDQVQSIATASEQQSAASEEINRSVEQVATISSETAQAMEQASSAVADLAQQSQALQHLIGEMKRQG